MVMGDSAKLDVMLRLRDDMSAGLKRASGVVERHQATFRKASLFMAGAATMMGGALLMSMRAGRELANTMDATRGAVERTGVDFEQIEGPLNKMAEGLSRVSNYTKTDVIETFRMLVSMTGSVEDALKLLPVAMDVAADRGVGLETAARNVSNAYRAGSGELVETYLPALKDVADASERLTLVEERFGGALEKNSDPIKVLTSGLNDMFAALGIYEIVADVTASLTKFANFLRDNLTESQLKAIGAGLVALFAVFTAGAVIAGILAMASVIGLIGGIVLAVGVLVAALLALWANWDTVWGFITTNFEKVSAFLSGVFRSKWAWLLPGGPFIKALLFIRDHWKEIWGVIKAAALTVWEGIKNIVMGAWDTIKALFTGDFGGVLDGLSRMWDGIKGIFSGGINAVIGFINILIRALNTIQVSIPSWVPKFGGSTFGINIPEVPKLAAGGIVRKPTLGLLGESGPEAVIPLRGQLAGAAGGLVVNVNMPTSGMVILDSETSARKLGTEITRQIRTELRNQRGW